MLLQLDLTKRLSSLRFCIILLLKHRFLDPVTLDILALVAQNTGTSCSCFWGGRNAGADMLMYKTLQQCRKTRRFHCEKVVFKKKTMTSKKLGSAKWKEMCQGPDCSQFDCFCCNWGSRPIPSMGRTVYLPTFITHKKPPFMNR